MLLISAIPVFAQGSAEDFEWVNKWLESRPRQVQQIDRAIANHGADAVKLASAVLENDRKLVKVIAPDPQSREDWQGHYFVFESLARLGLAFRHGQHWDEARQAYDESAELSGKIWEPTDFRVTDARRMARETLVESRLSDVQRKQLAIADEQEAKAMAIRNPAEFSVRANRIQEILDIRRQVLGEEHSAVVMTFVAAAKMRSAAGDHDGAEEANRQAAMLARTVYGARHPYLAIALNNLGFTLFQKGKSQESEQHYCEALEIREQVFGNEHPLTAEILSNLSVLHASSGQLESAERLQQKCLEIYRKHFPDDSAEIALCLQNLGGIYEDLRNYDRALDCFRDAARYYQTNAPESADYPHLLTRMGHASLSIGHLKEAVDYSAEAVKLGRKIYPRDSSNLLLLINNHAFVYASLGQYAEAEKVYRELEETLRSRGMSDHPWHSHALQNVAFTLHQQGRYAEALSLFQHAQDETLRVYGAVHDEYAKAVGGTAITLYHLGRIPDALEQFHTARQVRHRFAQQVMVGFSEAELIPFLSEANQNALYQALAFAVDEAELADVSNLSAEWVINGKSLLHEAIANRIQALQVLKTSADEPTIQELERVRRDLAMLAVQSPLSTGTGTKNRFEELQSREEELVRQTASLTRDLRTHQKWIELEVIQQALQDDELLVEYVRIAAAVDVKTGKARAPFYAAWLIRSSGTPLLINLGSAQAIEAAYQSTTSAITASPGILQSKAKTARQDESDLRLRANECTRLVLNPLTAHIRPDDRLVICPDAAIWLYPFEALPSGDNKYLTEDHEVRYLLSSRDLVDDATKISIETSEAIVMADPDYGQMPAALTSVFPPRTLSDLPELSRLAGTREEARVIEPYLQTYTGRPASLLLSDSATELRFRGLRSPQILAMATHGVFVDADKTETGTQNTHPFLRCGLALAGCNRRADENGDDGILTGVEILNGNLQGTELVVLSACQSAVGDIRNSEGLIGLRAAFHLAGARSVMATSWSVPDRDAMLMMESFFKTLSNGQTATYALANAQRERIAARRERFGDSHPFFWGAFTLTGNTAARIP